MSSCKNSFCHWLAASRPKHPAIDSSANGLCEQFSVEERPARTHRPGCLEWYETGGTAKERAFTNTRESSGLASPYAHTHEHARTTQGLPPPLPVFVCQSPVARSSVIRVIRRVLWTAAGDVRLTLTTAASVRIIRNGARISWIQRRRRTRPLVGSLVIDRHTG